MIYLGMAASLSVLYWFYEVMSGRIFSLFFLLCLVTLPLSFPGVYKRLPRGVCDGLRFSAGFIIPLPFVLIFIEQYAAGIGGAVMLFVFWRIYFQKRKNRKLKACDNCLEYGNGEICSGFKMQAEYIRKYEDEATRFMLNSGYMPDL